MNFKKRTDLIICEKFTSKFYFSELKEVNQKHYKEFFK